MPYHFTPVSIEGMMKNPPFENQVCYGLDLRSVPVERRLNIQYVIDMYNAYPDKKNFFTRYFNTLAGTDKLRKQIDEGVSEAEIRESWQTELKQYEQMREKYLMYPRGCVEHLRVSLRFLKMRKKIVRRAFVW